jgi:serralysin
MDPLRVCIDRSVPPSTLKERMALVKGAKWLPGDAIRAGFMDGDLDLRERVQTQAQEWTRHADLKLYFGALGNADIRISFSQDPGSWSYIGTQCRSIPANEATMNFGWLDKDSSDEEVTRVVLHEFGHALGCIHEHQNPAGGIKWNKPAVYEYYEGPPNNWSKADVDQNLFRLYDEKLTVHTKLDPKSIMMYPIPKAFTRNGFEVGLNTKLSATDVAYIKQQYS